MIRKIAIGDIHGCFNTLKHLLLNVIKITYDDELIFVGDYIDRGHKSKEVLDFLIQLIERGYNLFLLKGNHEEMFLNSYDEKYCRSWLLNGGTATLKSFSCNDFNKINRKYIYFIKDMDYYYETEDFIITHGGLNFDIDDPLEDEDAMLWTRNQTIDKAKIGNRRLIVGHTPTALIEVKKSLNSDIIKIDSGCVYAGRKSDMGFLSAYDFLNDKLYFTYNREEDES